MFQIDDLRKEHALLSDVITKANTKWVPTAHTCIHVCRPPLAVRTNPSVLVRHMQS